ncbi:NADP-dependent oxidoreductase domain-containing protein, partial [Mycena crocata]
VRLGKSGLKVSKLILGCMSYGNTICYDAGINTFDTANVYSDGLSEEVLGRAIKQHQLPRDEIVIMTKVFFPLSKDPTRTLFGRDDWDTTGYVNQHGLSRKHIFDSVKHSLRRLQLDYIDVLQCHRFDPDTPIEETMQALDDVVKAGYVRYVGMSSCYAWQCKHILHPLDYAINNKLTPFISMQNHYNMLYREDEREMFPTLKHFGVGAIPWSPLARGALTRPLDKQQRTKLPNFSTECSRAYTRRQRLTRRLSIGMQFTHQSIFCQLIPLPRVEEIAKKRGISMAQASVAWSMGKEGVSAPVIGSSSLANLADLVAAIHIKLTEEEVKYLEESYQPMAILGHYKMLCGNFASMCYRLHARFDPIQCQACNLPFLSSQPILSDLGVFLSFSELRLLSTIVVTAPLSNAGAIEKLKFGSLPGAEDFLSLVQLGQSGLKISKIVLGCMSYGNPNWWGNWVLPEEEGSKHIKAAYDAGINAFDTANTYSNGLSEEVLGRAIKQHQIPRDEIVIMTKVFYPLSRDPTELLHGRDDLDILGYPNQYGLSRKHIIDSVKHSLRRLQLDYIDLLQCHRFDPDTPIEETMQALHDVVKAGYVRYIGMSSCYAWQFNMMQNYAINNKLTPFVSMQNHYNLLYREEEREMFPALKHFGVGAIPWSPLARGALTRPLENQQQTKREISDEMAPNLYTQSMANQMIVNRVEEIAKKRGISMAQVSVAWAMDKEGVSAPIVGSTSLANLADLVGK